MKRGQHIRDCSVSSGCELSQTMDLFSLVLKLAFKDIDRSKPYPTCNDFTTTRKNLDKCNIFLVLNYVQCTHPRG